MPIYLLGEEKRIYIIDKIKYIIVLKRIINYIENSIQDLLLSTIQVIMISALLEIGKIYFYLNYVDVAHEYLGRENANVTHLFLPWI